MKPSILMIVMATNSLFSRFFEPIHTASLVVFRISFGLLMFFSTVRFILKGWIPDFYVEPIFHFTYLGFSWVQPWPEWGMMLHFIGLAILSVCIAVGLFYRASTVLFFLGFTYFELLDKTYYLNHYYAISLFSFLLIFLPLHRSFSLDCLRKPNVKMTHFPQWNAWLFQFQIGIIYFFAGVAKLNYDWLFLAEPLKTWLGSGSDVPILGAFFGWSLSPFLMSWIGVLYDLTIPFFLLNPMTRPYAYVAVIMFHALTYLLFSIGVFPWVMMVLSLVFFSPDWPVRVFGKIRSFWQSKALSNISQPETEQDASGAATLAASRLASHQVMFSKRFFTRSFCTRLGMMGIGLYVLIQLVLPFRYLLYPGPLFWREEGFRFSWRVMLMEKNGMLAFRVLESDTGQEWRVPPQDYLTPLQAKMMATQPDMILQFAHFLGDRFRKKLNSDQVEVYVVDSYVSLNGRRSQPFIDPTVNLLNEPRSLFSKRFILPQE